MSDDLETAARRELLAKEAELQDELAALTRLPEDQGSIGFGKRIGDGTPIAVERFTAVSVHDRLTETLAQVRAALAKLDAGTWRRCDTCGEPIDPARLEARPWATRCLPHS